MKKILLFVTSFLALTTLHCTKKQFLPFDHPHEAMLVKAKGQIEILQEPMKKEMILWDSTKVRKLPVEGILRVTYKDVDYFYLQLNCPQELKCNGKKAYIPRNLTHAVSSASIPFSGEFTEPVDIAESARFIVAPATSMASLIELQDWVVADVKKEIPALFNHVIFRANLPEKRTVVLPNLVFFARCIRSKKYPEHISDRFARQFPVFVELAKQGATKTLSPEQDNFIYQLHSAAYDAGNAIIEQEIDGFPFAHANYKAMAAAFNAIKEPVLLRGTLANRILKSTRYELVSAGNATTGPDQVAEQDSADKAAAQVGAHLSDQDGLVITYRERGENKTLKVSEEQITARPHAKGLAFVIGKEGSELHIIEPGTESEFLRNGNSEEIEKFIKAIPDYKHIIAERQFDQALLRIAMKYGKGQLDRQKKEFRYTIDLAQDRNFWIVLAAIKKYFGEDSENKFSGPIPTDIYPGAIGLYAKKGNINWYQKYNKDTKEAILGIRGSVTYCERSCRDFETDIVCLSNQDALELKFQPAALYASPRDKHDTRDSELVHADFRVNDGMKTCNEFFRMRLTEEKYQ